MVISYGASWFLVETHYFFVFQLFKVRLHSPGIFNLYSHFSTTLIAMETSSCASLLEFLIIVGKLKVGDSFSTPGWCCCQTHICSHYRLQPLIWLLVTTSCTVAVRTIHVILFVFVILLATVLDFLNVGYLIDHENGNWRWSYNQTDLHHVEVITRLAYTMLLAGFQSLAAAKFSFLRNFLWHRP